jgi:hypothetical protein
VSVHQFSLLLPPSLFLSRPAVDLDPDQSATRYPHIHSLYYYYYYSFFLLFNHHDGFTRRDFCLLETGSRRYIHVFLVPT